MKRILSMLLVAMLLVGCLSTVAYAAEGDRTKTVEITLNGPFASLGGEFTVNAPAKITNITGIDWGSNGKVSYYATDKKGTNVDSITVKVTVSFPKDSCEDEFTVKFDQDAGMKTLYDKDGNVAGYEKVTVTASKAFVPGHKFEEKAYKVTTEAENCQSKDKETATCKYCDATDTRDGDKGPHVAVKKWSSNKTDHWHACKYECEGVKLKKDEHSWGDWVIDKAATESAKGSKHRLCDVCDYKQTASIAKLNPNKDEVVDMGDITPYGTYNTMVFVTVAIVMLSVVALVNKRKTAK